MRGSYLSRYTPSLMSAEALEAIFVQREALAARLVDNIAESARTGNKHYALLVGGRGMGKTHLVSLVYHRVRRDEELRGLLRIAWLKEDEWGIADYLDLLRAMLRALLEDHGDPELAAAAGSLTKLQPSGAITAAEQLIRSCLGDKTLLLIIENLGDIFAALGKEGQEKFRALLQNSGRCTILATAQSIFADVKLRTSPFYGFFAVTHLPAFHIDDAAALLARIAEQQDDTGLAEVLTTAKGRARVRALHHLAGGNPRVYVIFSQFLTAESLDRLVEPLMQTLDDLTPYYQARMQWLSPQQRKIVEYLCSRRHAVPVTEIAEDNFVTHQTASSQLKKLRDLGYVRATAEGRESYYELQEPLMRIALEIKRMRGEPVELLVEFLRIWYSETELSTRLGALHPEAEIERKYLLRALEARTGSDDPVLAACLKDLHKYDVEKDYPHALDVTEELIAHKPCLEHLGEKVKYLCLLGRMPEALELAEKMIQMEPKNVVDWLGRGFALSVLGRYAQALETLDRVIDLAPGSGNVWCFRGSVLFNLGRLADALGAFEKAIELDSGNAVAWLRKGTILAVLGRYTEALQAIERTLELDPENSEAGRLRGLALLGLGRHTDALEVVDKAIDLDPQVTHGWGMKGACLIRLRRYEEARNAFASALELDPGNPVVWRGKHLSAYELGLFEEVLADCDRVLQLDPGYTEAAIARAVILSILGQYEEALQAFQEARRLSEAPSLDFELEHAVTRMCAGRWDEGRQAMDKALGDAVRKGGGRAQRAEFARNMLARTRDALVWERHIRVWIEVFEKHGALHVLGGAIVLSIRHFDIPQVTPEVARAWRDTWRKLGDACDALRLPLRLLDAAVAYKEKPGKKPLLGLAAEERQILEDLIRVPETHRV